MLKPFITTLAVFGALVAGSIAPGTAADAATVNWLDRACNRSSRVTACVEIPLDYDSLVKDGSLTFHDAAGKRIVASTGGVAWRLASQHSKTCVFRGDVHGCLMTSKQNLGHGRALVLHDGMAITLRFLDTH